MDVAFFSVLAGLASAALAAAVTVWNQRRHSPHTEATLVTASTLLLAQLQDRVAALEGRVSVLETENARYHSLYGPLPVED